MTALDDFDADVLPQPQHHDDQPHVIWSSLIPSATKDGIFYTVQAYSDGHYDCDCPARQFKHICRHIEGAKIMLEARDPFKDPAQPRKKPATKDLMLRWDVNQASLIDAGGEPITNAIARKALVFLDSGLVSEYAHRPRDGSRLWEVMPIEGYNSTVYTVWTKHTGDVWHGGCNCQHSMTKFRICSHLLAVIILQRLPTTGWVVEGNLSGRPRRLLRS